MTTGLGNMKIIGDLDKSCVSEGGECGDLTGGGRIENGTQRNELEMWAPPEAPQGQGWGRKVGDMEAGRFLTMKNADRKERRRNRS